MLGTSTVETASLLPEKASAMAVAAAETRGLMNMTPKRTGRFPRSARLLRHADFERVYKQGRRHFSATMTVFYCPRAEMQKPGRAEIFVADGLRIGFTVSRALGGAVQRNRMKRRLREAVRLSRPEVGPNADVVINPKKSLLAAEFPAVVKEVSRAFEVIEEKLARGGLAGAGSRAPASPAPEAERRS